MLIKQPTTRRLDWNQKPVHLLERIERIAAELERLDMQLPPDSVLFISALPHRYDESKQQFGGRNLEQSEALSAVIAWYPEMVSEERSGVIEDFVARVERRSQTSVEGVRCFTCKERNHFAKYYRSKPDWNDKRSSFPAP